MRSLLAATAALLAFAASAHAGPGLPDLIVTQPSEASYMPVNMRYFYPDDCSVVEGSVPSPGWHRLLEFPTDIANVGTADLRIGNPASHPEWFTFSPCHGHYHAPLALYELLDQAGTVVGTGHKQGFCLIDSGVYDTALAGRQTRPKYTNCDRNQGISAGWLDEYGMRLDGQWVVVDGEFVNGIPQGLPPGVYTLRITVNPSGLFPDVLTNNTRSVQVTIA